VPLTPNQEINVTAPGLPEGRRHWARGWRPRRLDDFFLDALEEADHAVAILSAAEEAVLQPIVFLGDAPPFGETLLGDSPADDAVDVVVNVRSHQPTSLQPMQRALRILPRAPRLACELCASQSGVRNQPAHEHQVLRRHAVSTCEWSEPALDEREESLHVEEGLHVSLLSCGTDILGAAP